VVVPKGTSEVQGEEIPVGVVEDGGERGNALAAAIMKELDKHILNLYGVLEREPNPKLLTQYDRDIAAGGRAAANAVRKAIAGPANRAAARGAMAGGFAFLPPYGTAASLATVVAATVPLLRSCVDAHDVVAHACGRALTEPPRRRAARLLVATATLPPQLRPAAAVWDAGGVEGGVEQVIGWDLAECERLWEDRATAMRQWVIGWTLPRASSVIPFGIGAFAGAWTGYAPVKSTIRAAERFYKSDHQLDRGQNPTDQLSPTRPRIPGDTD
jgi:hypothetical protein